MKTLILLALPQIAVLALPLSGWQLMIFYILTMFIALKAATIITFKKAVLKEKVLFSAAWIGMNYEEFSENTNSKAEFFSGSVSLALGLLLSILALFCDAPVFKAAVIFTAMLFIFHFGLLDLNAQIWKALNRNVKPIMNAPWRAKNLADFWGNRWNMAFRDAAHRLIFLPVKKKLGPLTGVMAVFIFSGIMHEAVISVPAGGGYGGPFIYFILQFTAICLQRNYAAFNNRVFTWLILSLPLSMLFHKPFFVNVFLPLTELIGG